MPNDLPIPLDLNHLIEKREQEEQRQAERRNEENQSNSLPGKISDKEIDRRSKNDRRENIRRLSDDCK